VASSCSSDKSRKEAAYARVPRDYFEALKRDFRYQLMVIEQFAQAIIPSDIKNNRWTIKTGRQKVAVSVTGVRRDK
jgi:trimeric autotransporter adhesin